MNIAKHVVQVAAFIMTVTSLTYAYAASPMTMNKNTWYLPRKASSAPLTALKINGISYMRNASGQVVKGSGSVNSGGVDMMPGVGSVNSGGVDMMPRSGSVNSGGVDMMPGGGSVNSGGVDM